MGKHLKHDNSSTQHGNHKFGWFAGMLHLLDFHQWRTHHRPICWRTPRTHSLVRETDDRKPFLGNGDSEMVTVSENSKRRQSKVKKMTTKQVTEYVDILEILRNEEVFVKIMKDPDSEFGKQVQIKSNPRALPKSGSFPLASSSRALFLRPTRMEHKQKENWYVPKEKGPVLTLNVPRVSITGNSQQHPPIFPSNDHGFNHAVMNGFREIKRLLKKALKDRKHKKKLLASHSQEDDLMKVKLTGSLVDSVGRYSQLLEQSFRRGPEFRSRSLRLSYEKNKSESSDNIPLFFRRISSLSSLEVLGSFLNEIPQESSTSNLETRKSVDQDITNYASEKGTVKAHDFLEKLQMSESGKDLKRESNLPMATSSSSPEPLRLENEEEEEEERIPEYRRDSNSGCENREIVPQDPELVPSTDSSDDSPQKTEALLSENLGLTSHNSQTDDINFSVGIQKQSTFNFQDTAEHNRSNLKEDEEGKDIYFSYVKKVLEISGFLEGEQWYSEEQPLNPSLLYESDLCSIQEEALNKELLFDLVNDSIVETYIYFPKTLSFGRRICPIPKGKRFIDEIWGRVQWSLIGSGGENKDRSLDDIVGRDLTKSDGWMDLEGESEWLALEIEYLIFDAVLDEMICDYS